MFRQLEEFIYPDDLAQAVRKRHEYGEAAAPIAGGTEIVPNLPEGIRCLIDVTGLGLDYIEEEADRLKIGATSTMQTLALSPVIARVANGMLASSCCHGWPKEVRNTATLGGNLVGAGPFADTPPALLALDAEVVVARVDGEETIPMQDFFVGYRRTAVGSGILREVQIPRPSAHTRGVFLKFTQGSVDQALVNVAVTVDFEAGLCRKVRIAVGAVGRTPHRVFEAECALLDRPLVPELIDQAAQRVSELIDPVIDLRASADYRREMAGVLTRRALHQLAS